MTNEQIAEAWWSLVKTDLSRAWAESVPEFLRLTGLREPVKLDPEEAAREHFDAFMCCEENPKRWKDVSERTKQISMDAMARFLALHGLLKDTPPKALTFTEADAIMAAGGKVRREDDPPDYFFASTGSGYILPTGASTRLSAADVRGKWFEVK